MWFDDAGDVVRVLAVGLASYALLLGVLRLSGKRTLAKLSAFDLVVTVAFGSVLATSLLSPSASFSEAAVALAALAAAQYVVAVLVTRLPLADRVVRATPRALVVHGRVDPDALAAERVSLADVRAAVRQSGRGRVEDVTAVVLETDGSLSVVGATDPGRPATAMRGVRGWPGTPADEPPPRPPP